ncbi:MAG: DUF6316 family protein [Gammaproteobacteria bacterium]|jgi:Domain of unknown function (DUF6316)
MVKNARNRRGETRAIPFRSRRLFEVNGSWYVALRGELPKGPYESKQEAAAELVELLRREAMFGHAIWR